MARSRRAAATIGRCRGPIEAQIARTGDVLLGSHPKDDVVEFDMLSPEQYRQLVSRFPKTLVDAGELSFTIDDEERARLVETATLPAGEVTGRIVVRQVFVCLACGAHAMAEAETARRYFAIAKLCHMRTYNVVVLHAALIQAWGELVETVAEAIPLGAFGELEAILKQGADYHRFRERTAAIARTGRPEVELGAHVAAYRERYGSGGPIGPTDN